MIDIYSHTATGKLINQDYILTNLQKTDDGQIKLQERNYIILSDGCSGSKESDIGARILCKVAQSILEQNLEIDYFKFRTEIINKSTEIANNLNLSLNALQATLIVAFFDLHETTQELKIKVLIYGDGIIGWKYKNQNTEINTFFNIHSAPFYMMYNTSEDLLKKYEEKFGTEIQIENYLNNEFQIISKSIYEPLYYELNMNEIESFFISSDGLQSFSDNGILIDPQIIIQNILNLNSFVGCFLHRKMNKLIKKNPHHEDDVSIGMILNK